LKDHFDFKNKEEEY